MTRSPSNMRDPLLALIWFGLGNFNTGLIVNAISDDYKWRALPVTALTTAGVAAVWVLQRKVHPESEIGRRAPFTLSVLAMISAIATTVDRWAAPASLVAIALIAVAVFVPGDINNAWYIVSGFSFVGLGVAALRFSVIAAGGVTLLPNSIFIVLGLSCVGFVSLGAGVGLLRRNVIPLKIVSVVLGISATLSGAVLISTSEPYFGLATIAVGIVSIGCGCGLLFHWRMLFGVTVTVFGVEVLALALSFARMNAIFGAIGVLFGLLVASGGLAVLRRSKFLAGIAVTGQGLIFVGLGLASVLRDGTLTGVILFSAGLMSAVYGVKILFRIGTFERIRLLLVRWSEAPPRRAKLRPKRFPGVVYRNRRSTSFFGDD